MIIGQFTAAETMATPRIFTEKCMDFVISKFTNKVRIQIKRFSSTKLQHDDYSRFLTFVARNRKPSLIRQMTDLQARSSTNTIHFAGGFPNPCLFPFKEANFKLYDGVTIELNGKSIAEAQQYSPTTGHPTLRKKLVDLIYEHHQPPCWDSSFVAVTCGSQDGFSRCIEMILSPGDYVIVEEPSFCGALAVMNPYKPNYLGIEVDEYGMIPEKLEIALQKWDHDEMRLQDNGIPKFIYLNPSGANPSGVSITYERKKMIYQIAQDYNLLILEDDPYYFLQFDDINKCPPSFLSMDVDGRVIRFDSFSKIMASGLRVGIATGPKTLIMKIVQHSEVTLLHTATLSQVLINEVLEQWGKEGFNNHIYKVRKFYEQQRDFMIDAANIHLNGLCEWNVPIGGMFLWAKVIGVKDTTEMALKRGIDKEILLMPGNTFMTDDNAPCAYIRLSFSFASAELMQEGCRRLAELIREERERDENLLKVPI